MTTSRFVVQPASLDDIPSIAELQYLTCASDPGFNAIFRPPPSDASLAHLANQLGDMSNDPTTTVAIVKDVSCGAIASYAVWSFVPPKQPETVEKEMMADVDPSGFPPDANIELGKRLIKNSVRKQKEVATECFGMGQPYMYFGALGTAPAYQRQGAAYKLMELALQQAGDKMLPIYIESTPIALALYKKFGFQEYDRLEIDLRPDAGSQTNTCLVKLW